MVGYELNFNEKKTFLVAPLTPLLDLSSLVQHIKPTITNLGVKIDVDLKLDSQIRAVVRSSYHHLRQLAKIKPILSRQQFETVIHVVTTRLDNCNALYVGVSESSISRLQMVQNAAVRPLTGIHKHEHISPILASLHWLPIQFRIQLNII